MNYDVPADRTAFAGGMAKLGLAFNREVTRPLIRVYFEALHDFDQAEWAHAVERAVSTCKFFPAVAELRAFARPKLSGGDIGRAFDAVTKLGRHHPRLGTQFPRPETVALELGAAAAEAYVAAGGAAAFEKATRDDDLTWVRKAFHEGYREAAAAGVLQLPNPDARRALPTAVQALIGTIGSGPHAQR